MPLSNKNKKINQCSSMQVWCYWRRSQNHNRALNFLPLREPQNRLTSLYFDFCRGPPDNSSWHYWFPDELWGQICCLQDPWYWSPRLISVSSRVSFPFPFFTSTRTTLILSPFSSFTCVYLSNTTKSIGFPMNRAQQKRKETPAKAGPSARRSCPSVLNASGWRSLPDIVCAFEFPAFEIVLCPPFNCANLLAEEEVRD